MREFNIAVPEEKVSFFLELMKSLGFVSFDTVENVELTSAQKKVIDERLAAIKNDPNRLLNWEDVAKEIEEEA